MENLPSTKKDIIGIVGAGQMGRGIAQVFASFGFKTFLLDSSQEALTYGISKITKSLDKLVEKSKISKEAKEFTLNNIFQAKDLNQLSECSLVIEAIVENYDIKANLFREIEQIVSQDCIVATNTSSISITKLAACLKDPERVIGMHFMNPAPVMKLVEVVKGLKTNEKTYKKVIDLTEQIDKVSVTAQRDFPGFIVNRILVPMINEAFFTLMEGVASAEEIDTAMKLGTNQPMGPLLLADFVGLDTVLYITRIFHQELGDDKYRPCPLLIKYVEAGMLGVKTGEGVYKHQ